MARSFDGTDDNVSFGSDASVDSFVSRTASLWTRVDGGADVFDILIGKGSWFIAWQGFSSLFSFDFYQNTSTPDTNWTGSTPLTAAPGFRHVVVTYDGSSMSNDPVLYIDGTINATTEDAAPTVAITDDAGNNLTIGEHTTGGQDFLGLLGWVCYDNTIWTAAQVNRARWWGTPGGSIKVYHPLMTTKLTNEGTATANGTATGTTMDSIPRVERCWMGMMGVGR